MRCERHSRQTVEQPGEDTRVISWIHCLRCEECRRAYAADRLVERASEQIRIEPPPQDSLAKTLAAAGCSAAVLSAESRRATRMALARALALVGVGIFVTTLAQPEQIGRSFFGSPQELGASAQHVAGFWALLGLFWYLKPAAALLLETIPTLISRRKMCLLGSIVCAALLWILACLPMHALRAHAPAIGIVVNAMLALASTILGGYVVEQAHRIGASGRLGALHQAAAHLGAMAAPFFGLAAGGILTPTVAASLLALFGIMAAIALPRDTRASARSRPVGIASHLVALGRARALWQVTAMLLLIFGAFSFDALLTRQQEVHGFSLAQRSQLIGIAHAATLASILAYAVLCRRVRLQSLLPAGILANAAGTLLYLAYTGPLSFQAAESIEIINGVGSALIVVTLFDLAIRAVPRQCVYLGYAIVMSVSNLASSLSEVITASLPLGFTQVILLSAFSSTLALLVVVRLPAALVNRREGEPMPGAAQMAPGNL